MEAHCDSDNMIQEDPPERNVENPQDIFADLAGKLEESLSKKVQVTRIVALFDHDAPAFYDTFSRTHEILVKCSQHQKPTKLVELSKHSKKEKKAWVIEVPTLGSEDLESYGISWHKHKIKFAATQQYIKKVEVQWS